MRDIGGNGESAAALSFDAANGILGGSKIDVGDGDLGALAREQQAHGPAVADRIGRGIERALAAADHQHAAAFQAAASGRLA